VLPPGNCPQDKIELQIRYEQRLMEARSAYDAAIGSAQTKSALQLADAKSRFDRTRASLDEELRSTSR